MVWDAFALILLMLGLGMLIGRFGYILPVLALAGSLAMK